MRLCVQIFLPALTFLVGLVVLNVSGNITLAQPPLLMDVTQFNTGSRSSSGYTPLPVPINNQSYACIGGGGGNFSSSTDYCGGAPAFDSMVLAMNSLNFSVSRPLHSHNILSAGERYESWVGGCVGAGGWSGERQAGLMVFVVVTAAVVRERVPRCASGEKEKEQRRTRATLCLVRAGWLAAAVNRSACTAMQ